MRLLLDESLPRVLAHSIEGHDVATAQEMGWAGVKNGELLQRAAESGFEALITPDKGFEFQQNLTRLPLTVLIVRSRSNRIEDLAPLVPSVLIALEEAKPCQLVHVGA